MRKAMFARVLSLGSIIVLVTAWPAVAQRPESFQQFVAVEAPIIALTMNTAPAAGPATNKEH